MALTVTTDLTVITNGNDGTWNDIGGGGGSAAEPDYFIQGTGCRSRAVSGSGASRGFTVDIGAGNELDFSSGGANEDELIYFWIQDYTPGLTDNVASAPGLTIRIAEGATNGSDYAEWDIIYSDLLAPPGTEFFRVYALDPRAPPTRTSGTWDYNTCRHFGGLLETNATAKGQNIGIDRISHGFGELKVTGTADSAASGFQEILDANWNTVNDSVAIGSNGTARNGIIEVKGTTAFVKGKLVIGDDTGTLATTFTGQDTKFEWLETFYYDGTRVRTTVGYDDSQNYTGRKSDGTSYFGVDIRGNGTGDTDTTFGAAVGADQGRSGPSFTGTVKTPCEFTVAAAAEDVLIYGTTFENFRSIDLGNTVAADKVFGNTLKKCGTLVTGSAEYQNNNVIQSIGAAYTYLEDFINIEASAAEALATADPTTEWTALLNGADLSIPASGSAYCELLGGTTRTNIVLLDDDKVGADNHYAEMIIRFPSGGSGQGTLGPVIAGDSAAQDYFYLDIDLVNDQISLIRCNTGTDTTIAGPTAFTMDEDEDYIVLLRRNGTTIEGFASGNSVADGFHTTRVGATDSAHTGTTHRLPGIRGDALAGQTGDAPQMRNFGCGPITDDFGAVELPTTANEDYNAGNFIQCARAIGVKNAGSYGLDGISISECLVGFQNDAGSVTINLTNSTSGGGTENFGTNTTTVNSAAPIDVSGATEGTSIIIIANETVGTLTAGDVLSQQFADSNGEASYSLPYESAFNPSGLDVLIKARNQGIAVAAIAEDSGTGFTDETSEASSNATADMILLPTAGTAVNDAYYFGHNDQFAQLKLDVSTAFAGTSLTIVWEYWNGSSWASLTGVTDGTNGLLNTGPNVVSFTIPGGWATTTVNSQGPLYYVRFRVTAVSGETTVPIGRKVSLDVNRYLPYNRERTVTAAGITDVVSWNRDAVSQF